MARSRNVRKIPVLEEFNADFKYKLNFAKNVLVLDVRILQLAGYWRYGQTLDVAVRMFSQIKMSSSTVMYFINTTPLQTPRYLPKTTKIGFFSCIF